MQRKCVAALVEDAQVATQPCPPQDVMLLEDLAGDGRYMAVPAGGSLQPRVGALEGTQRNLGSRREGEMEQAMASMAHEPYREELASVCPVSGCGAHAIPRSSCAWGLGPLHARGSAESCAP